MRQKGKIRKLCDKSLSKTATGIKTCPNETPNYTYKIEEVTHNYRPEESSDSYKIPERRGISYNFLQTTKGLGGQIDKRTAFLSDLDRIKVKMLVVSAQASLNNSVLPTLSRKASPHILDYSQADQSMSLYDKPKMQLDMSRHRQQRQGMMDPRLRLRSKNRSKDLTFTPSVDHS